MTITGRRQWDDVMLFVCSACVLPLVILACRSAYAALPRLRALLEEEPEGSSSLVERKFIEQKLMEQKLQQYLVLIQTACTIFLAWDLLVVVALLSGGGENRRSMLQDVSLVVLQLINTFIASWPRLLTRKTMDFHYSSFMLVFAFFIFTVEDRNFTGSLLIANICVCLGNGVRRTVESQRLPLCAICNLVFAACASHAIYSNNPNRFPTLIVGQVLIIMTYATVSALMERASRSNMGQSLQFQVVQELYGAACALLRSCCHVVVGLDKDGVIVSADENFAGFLLRSSMRFEGTSFASLLLDEDRAHFNERLRQPKMRKVGMAEQLAVSIRDGSGNVLRLDLLWFEYRLADGERRIMLGLRELSDAQEARPTLHLPSTGSEPAVLCRPYESSSGTPTSLDTTPTSLSTTLTSLSTADSFSSESLGEAAVLLDISEASMPVREVTPAFCAQLGRLPLGQSFLQHVRHPERFVQALGQFFLDDLPGTEGRPHFIRASLKMPAGRVDVRCRVARASWQEEEQHIRLCFCKEVRLPSRRLPGTAHARSMSL